MERSGGKFRCGVESFRLCMVIIGKHRECGQQMGKKEGVIYDMQRCLYQCHCGNEHLTPRNTK